MKVKKEIVQAAILKLIDQITSTMPNSTYKFVLGGAATFASLKSSQQMNNLLNYVSDENGLVDVDLLQQMIDGAFKASNNKLQLEFFNQPSILSLFIKPITVTIQKQDIDILMQDIKQNAVSNEVSITPMSSTTTEIK